MLCPTPWCVIRITAIAFFLIFAGVFEDIWAAEPDPSFDCRKASTKDEIIICDSVLLSLFDRKAALGFDYVKRVHGLGTARRIGRSILRERGQCGSDFFCIGQVQRQAILTYQSYGAPISEPDLPSFDDRASKRAERSKRQRELQDAWRECLLEFAARSAISGAEPAIIILKGSFSYCQHAENELYKYLTRDGGFVADFVTDDLFPALKGDFEDKVLAVILKLRQPSDEPESDKSPVSEQES